jgi:hypothetical protein
MRPYLEKSPTQKKGLVEWLEVSALSSNPSITTTTTKRKKIEIRIIELGQR